MGEVYDDDLLGQVEEQVEGEKGYRKGFYLFHWKC